MGSCPPGTVEFWFELGSNYSYPGVMRIEEAAVERGAKLAWRPFLLEPIFRSFGWESSPFVLQTEKGAHVWIDVERQCRKQEIPWKKPSSFPQRAILPMKVALVGTDQPRIGACKRMMLLNVRRDAEIDAGAPVRDVLEGLGLPADSIINAAPSEQTKSRLRDQTTAAQPRGIFGAHTFFVGDDVFWGNGRLEDAWDMAAGMAAGCPQSVS